MRRSTPGAVASTSDAAAGTRRSSSPWRTSVGSPNPARAAARTRACSASASAPKRAVLVLTQYGSSDGLRRHRRIARQGRAVDAVRDRERRRDPGQRPARAPSSSRPASSRAPATRGPRGRASADRPAGSPRTIRPPIECPYRTTGRPAAAARTAASRSARSSWNCDHRSTSPASTARRRRCRDGRRRRRRGPPPPAGRRRARSGRSARRDRGRAGPSAHGAPGPRPAGLDLVRRPVADEQVRAVRGRWRG